MRKYATHGFTIVELLVVIIVIGILAAVTVAAFSNTQQRSRTAARITAIRSIQKGLESYRTIHGHYPPDVDISTNQPAGFTPVYGDFYEYSVATNDSWMQVLRQSGTMNKKIVDPKNDNNHHFIYISYSTGTGSCREPFYMLASQGWEGGYASMPPDARTLNCSISGLVTAGWTLDTNRAIFSNLNHPVGE
ncbi:MAG: type II secretion system protein [Candidatus Saccharimonadales bacterium]